MSDMATTYRTVDGDVLDAVVASHYGRGPDAVTDVLKVNPHLRHYSAVLPSGVDILLPVLATARPVPTVFLIP